MILRELIVKLGFNVDASKLKNFDKWVDQTSHKLEGMSKKLGSFGMKASIGLTLPILAAGAAMVNAASDAEETESKFNSIFRDMVKGANDVADAFGEGYGQSSTNARKLLGNTADLLTGFNFTQKAALDLSKQVNELAVDLASFQNFEGGAEGASQALTKALLGEREGVKALGIAIMEEDVKAKVLEMRKKGITFQTERQAKAYATLLIAQEQSKNAMGDFARTQAGFANQWRIMRNGVNDMAVSFGKILLPTVTKIVGKFILMFKWFKNLSDSSKKLILIIAGIAAVVGPLVLALAGLLGLVGFLMAGFTGLAASIGIANGALLLLMGKVILAIAAVAAAFAAIFLVVDDLINYFQGNDSVTGVIMDSFGRAIDWVKNKFAELPIFVQVIAKMIMAPFLMAFDAISGIWNATAKAMTGDFKGAWTTLGGAGQNMIGRVTDIAKTDSTVPSTLTSAGGGNSSSVNVQTPITINVPANTPPGQVGDAVRAGVFDSFDAILQSSGRHVATSIME